jgi:hypothetical protein
LQFHALTSDGERDGANALHLLQDVHFRAEGDHCLGGAEAVLTGEEALDDGAAFGHGGEHDGAVADAFVTGDGDFSGDLAEFLDFDGGHRGFRKPEALGGAGLALG